MRRWILGFVLLAAAASCDLRPAGNRPNGPAKSSPAPTGTATAVKQPAAPGDGCTVTLTVDGMT